MCAKTYEEILKSAKRKERIKSLALATVLCGGIITGGVVYGKQTWTKVNRELPKRNPDKSSYSQGVKPNGIIDSDESSLNPLFNLTPEEIREELHTQLEYSNANLSDATNFLLGKIDSIDSKNVFYFNFEESFGPGTHDYYAVKLFSDMKNDFLKACEDGDRELAKDLVKDIYNISSSVILSDEGCIISYRGGTYFIDFNNLDYIAKDLVLSIANYMITLPVDYAEKEHLIEVIDALTMNNVGYLGENGYHGSSGK